MRNSEDFRTTIRRGVKAAQPTLVTHVLLHGGDETSVGFVVSKAVGNAVERNRVKRRLRHLMQERIDRLPQGSRVVVRALPSASGSSSLSLAEHLDLALTRSGGL